MTNANRSLMDFIQTPVIVGDPDGRTVYVNPAFETDFLIASEDVVGRPLANLFEGGGREAVLHAVVGVCHEGTEDTARFGLIVQDRGYRALVSAVEAEGGRVGVIMLLLRESSLEARVQVFRREIFSSLDELSECLSVITPQAGDALAEEQGLAVADANRCVERMRKWCETLAASLDED